MEPLWVKTPLSLLTDKKIGGEAIRVYGLIRSYDRPGGKCCPTHAQLAKTLQISRQAVQRHAKTLTDAGYIGVDLILSPGSRYPHSEYQFFDPPLNRQRSVAPARNRTKLGNVKLPNIDVSLETSGNPQLRRQPDVAPPGESAVLDAGASPEEWEETRAIMERLRRNHRGSV